MNPIILLTRSPADNCKDKSKFEQKGCKIVCLPFIEFHPLHPKTTYLTDFIQSDWLFFTSTHGIDFFFSELATDTVDIQNAIHRKKIACVGEKTAKHLKKYQLYSTFIPSIPSKSALVYEWYQQYSQTEASIFYPRSKKSGRYIGTFFKQKKYLGKITSSVFYDTLPPKNLLQNFLRIENQTTIDYIYFASPSAWLHYQTEIKKYISKKEPVYLAIGETTAHEIEKAGCQAVRLNTWF